MQKYVHIFNRLIIILCLSLLFTSLPINSFAFDIIDSGVCGYNGGDNVTWTLDNEGTLVLSGSGETTNFSVFEGRTDIVNIVISEGITDIGYSLFQGLPSLKSVTCPLSLKTIGAQAFNGCSSLSSVSLNNGLSDIGVRAFASCSDLQSIDFPASLKTIQEKAFLNSGLGSVLIPDNVNEIGLDAFKQCQSLSSVIVYANELKTASAVFQNCTALTNAQIYGMTDSLGQDMFKGCSNLKTVSFLDDFSPAISLMMFMNCTSLESVRIPSSVTSISMAAFYNCNNLKYVFYSGTQEQWQDMTISAGNDVLTNGTAVIHYEMSEHVPVSTGRANVVEANCYHEGSYDESYICAQDGCDYVFETAHIVTPITHVNTVEVPESDSTETEHGYTAGVYCNDCEQFISGHEEKPLIGEPEEPTTEPEEPTTEPPEEITTEPEEPTTEPEAPTTEPEEPVTEPTAPTTEPTTVPATAPTGAIHGSRCFCYSYTGNGLLANIVRFICATYSFLWNLRDALI